MAEQTQPERSDSPWWQPLLVFFASLLLAAGVVAFVFALHGPKWAAFGFGAVTYMELSFTIGLYAMVERRLPARGQPDDA